MALSVVGLIVVVALLAVLAAAIYRAFQGQWWPLVLVVCIPLALLFFVSFVSYREVQRVAPTNVAIEKEGEQFVGTLEATTINNEPLSSAEAVVATTRLDTFILFPAFGVLLLLAFFAVKSFTGQQRSHSHHNEDGHGGHRYQHSGLSSGWAFAGLGLLLLVAAFVAFLFLAAPREVAQMSKPPTPEIQAADVHGESFMPGHKQPRLETNTPDRPTAELWEKLTEARIDLDGEDEVEGEQDTSEAETETTEQTDEDQETEQEAEAPPNWVNNPPKPVGNLYRVVTTSDLFSTEGECYDQLEEKFYFELRRGLTRILPKEQGDLVNSRSVAEMGVPLNYIMQNICQDSYAEILDTSVGPMKKVHVLMEFDSDAQRELREKWISYRRGLGLATVTKIFSLLLASLAIGFVLLQVDTWTRGYYTKRLLLGLPVAIIAIALLLLA